MCGRGSRARSTTAGPTRTVRRRFPHRRGAAHTDAVPDEVPWVDPIVVPDDLRDLQADVETYHREQRLAARRRRVERLTGWPRWQRLALPLAASVCSLALAGVVFAVLTLGNPRPDSRPTAAPVAA